MGFFSKKREDSPEFRRKMAKKLTGKSLRYVSERVVNKESAELDETVIGKNGFFFIDANDNLGIKCENGIVFRARITELSISELLSLEGAILNGYDLETAKQRQVVAYYVYHRK